MSSCRSQLHDEGAVTDDNHRGHGAHGDYLSKRRAEMNHADSLEPLLEFLERLPAMRIPAGRKSIGSGIEDDGRWWVKFSLDTDHPLAWRVVQELGHVLNDMSTEERLPTVFKPVSPPPYLNGGVEFLSWVIESHDAGFTPALCAKWLQGRLPDPVTDLDAWKMAEDAS